MFGYHRIDLLESGLNGIGLPNIGLGSAPPMDSTDVLSCIGKVCNNVRSLNNYLSQTAVAAYWAKEDPASVASQLISQAQSWCDGNVGTSLECTPSEAMDAANYWIELYNEAAKDFIGSTQNVVTTGSSGGSNTAVNNSGTGTTSGTTTTSGSSGGGATVVVTQPVQDQLPPNLQQQQTQVVDWNPPIRVQQLLPPVDSNAYQAVVPDTTPIANQPASTIATPSFLNSVNNFLSNLTPMEWIAGIGVLAGIYFVASAHGESYGYRRR